MDYKKTAIKGLIIAAMGAVSGLLAWVLEMPPTSTIVIGTALLRMAENWLKNKNK